MANEEKTDMTEPSQRIISEENAQAQIDIFMKKYRKDLRDYSEEQLKGINVNMNKAKRAIRDGFLEIKKTSNGKVEFNVAFPQRLINKMIKYFN